MIFLFNRIDDQNNWVTESIKKLDLLMISKIEYYVEKNRDKVIDGKVVNPSTKGVNIDIRSSQIM